MRTVQLQDFLKYTFLSGLCASPNEEMCAFVTSNCDLEKNGYTSRIQLLDVDSGNVRALTAGGEETSPVWLDDDTLLYTAPGDEALRARVALGEPWTVYYAVDVRTGESREYMRIPKTVHSLLPVDKNTFAVIADHSLDEPDPHTIPAAERDAYLAARKERLESYAIADEMPFRHNAIGFHNGIRSGLYIFRRDSGALHLVTEETRNVDFYDVQGRRVVFSARAFRKEEYKRFMGGLCVLDVDTLKVTEYVAEEPYRMRYCSFLQGKPVFVGSDGVRYGYQENPYFYYIDEQEGKEHAFATNELSAQNATGSDVRYGSSPEIQAYGDSIYYVGSVGGDSFLKRARLNGGIETVDATPGAIDGIAVLKSGVVMIALRENRLQEIYLLKDGVETRLTAFNEWVQQECALSTPECVPYKNHYRDLQGYVLKPVGYDPAKKYPAILYIHGGHKLAFGSVFHHELQLYAAKGYFVFYCNPFGSDGGDNEFADVIGRYGFEDYSDIMKFTDVVLDRFPQIDRARVGVGGGSYGGYMTNWIIGHTDRFRCAVSQRSISNFVSDFLTSDTGYLFPMWTFTTSPWMDTDRYWMHSPLKYANQCTTPTLFIHAEEDYRCPVSEGIQMYSALKYHGIEARLCLFHGENHELSRSGKPKNRINRLLEITAWFDAHLCADK